MFRSYRAFAPKLYQLIMCILYPLFAVFCCVLVQNGFFGSIADPGYHYMVAAGMLCNCMIAVECMGDYWLFSGIQAKNANHMDFIKGSKKGKAFFLNALMTDVLRRAIVIVVCNAANVLIGIFVFHQTGVGMEGMLLIATYTLSCYAFSTLGVFISRFGDTWIMNMGAGYFGAILSAVMTYVYAKSGIPTWIFVLIHLVISIIITVITVKFAMKKVEDSYYDQRS